MQNLIVALIILAAAVYVGRRFYRSTRTKSSCGCGCEGCGAANARGDIADAPFSGDCADIRSRTAGEIADEMAERDDQS